MKIYEYSGKTVEEAKKTALKDLEIEEEDAIVNIQEEKAGLFRGKKVSVLIYKKDEIAEFVRNELNTIAKLIGIEIKMETKIRGSHIGIKMYSDNNSILIGKNGQTLLAFQNIIKQSLLNQYNIRINIILDVEQYKENQNKSIEYLAKKIASEVANTKIEVKLDSMNSYQRRIVHNALKDYKNVYSVSEGIDPNRYVIIKPKED